MQPGTFRILTEPQYGSRRMWRAAFCFFAATAVLTLMLPAFFAKNANAGMIEISSGFSFTQSSYGDDSYNWSRTWGASFGYYFTDLTELEVGFQDITDRTHIPNYQDTTFRDRVYSLDWSQSFSGKHAGFQPYVKLGIGQLNRDATGSYVNGASPPAILDSVIGIMGAGFKIYLTRNLGLRGEATSYLSGGSIRSWKDNTKITFGFSLYL